MPELSLNKPHLEVTYQPKTFTLRITWKWQVSVADLESGYRKILEFLRKYPVGRILLDLSQRDKLEIAGGTQHIFGDIFKEALQVIKRPLFLAMVLTREEF